MFAHASASEASLVRRARAGERAALAELVRRCGAGVRGLVRRMGAGDALADDIAQDAFLAAFENIARFRGEGSFEGWVKAIAARGYVKRWRRDGRMIPMAETPEPSQAAPRVGDDERLDLDAALNTLAQVERVAVSLCAGAGFTHEEAAQMLRLPLGTVKSHVKRGLYKLRMRLAPERTPKDGGHE
jgi:RNA polymerase sigma factor (sigma-70 family)